MTSGGGSGTAARPSRTTQLDSSRGLSVSGEGAASFCRIATGAAMFDVEKFIHCIHERPTLWDSQLGSYSDKNARDRAWCDLGADMYKEWHTFDEEQADKKVKEMKSKWRHIRDNYLKDINQRSHSGLRKKRKYVYTDKLAFLQNSVGKKRVVTIDRDTDYDSGIHPQGDDQDYTNQEGEFGDSLYADYDVEDISSKISSQTATEPAAQMCLLDMPESSFPQTSSALRISRQDSEMNQFQVDVMKRLDALQKPAEEDPDKCFLMSILPDYKKLSEEEKLDFRINCLHFFRDVKQPKNTNLKRE